MRAHDKLGDAVLQRLAQAALACRVLRHLVGDGLFCFRFALVSEACFPASDDALGPLPYSAIALPELQLL